MGGRAELVPDRGAGAEAGEFFRSRAFHEAEGVTHTLVIESGGDAAALAVIVREIPGSDRVDAISAYGYPGAGLPADWAATDPREIDWGPSGLVSLFARERLGSEPLFASPTVRGRVLIHDPARPRDVRARLAEQIRHNERLGYRIGATPGPDVPPAELAAFHAAYIETMRRADAAERYLFSESYLRSALAFERSWLLIARSPRGEGSAGAIAAVSDGFLHYFLGGTATEALDDSPFKNVVAAMLDLADELGTPLNLGGGVSAGDGLERFKRGFANSELEFRTHEVVCDPVAYRELSGPRDAGGFFPAYRAPA